jgi:hypothetical protein
MAKSKKPTKRVGGPFVAAAVFCNSILEDSDSVVSALRIVDEVQITVSSLAPPDFPSKANPLEIPLWGLIIIRRGDADSGKHELRLVIEQPDGKSGELSKHEITLPDHPNGATTIKSKMLMKLHSPGVFWVDVILDGKRLTRMPLNLLIHRPETPVARS